MSTPLSSVTSVALAFLAVTSFAACSATRAPAPADSGAAARPTEACASGRAPSRRPEDRRLYRIDLVLTSTEVGRAPVTTTHSLHIEEDSPGEIRIGRNVPLTPSNARQDVGLLLRCSFHPVGDDVLLQTNVEVSAMEDAGAIRKISLRGDALLSPGTTALVASTEDPVGQRRFEVTGRATRLR